MPTSKKKDSIKKTTKVTKTINNVKSEKNNQYFEIYDHSISLLENFFSREKLTSNLINNDEFQHIIQTVFSINYSIAIVNKIPNRDKIIELVKKYNLITSNNFEPKSNINISDTVTINDEINWFATYCLNKYNVNIKNEKIEQEEMKQIADEIVLTSELNSTLSESNIKPNQDNYSMLLEGYRNLKNKHKEVEQQIANGEIYLYNTKPKIIPILRLGMIILSSIYAVVLLTTIICLIVILSDSSRPEKLDVSYLCSCIILLFLAIVIISVTIKKNIMAFIKKNNQSQYYFFNLLTQYVLNVVVTCIVISYLLVISSALTSISNTNGLSIANFFDSTFSYNAIYPFTLVLVIIYGVLSLIMAGYAYAITIFNPKANAEVVNRIKETILEDISSNLPSKKDSVTKVD